MPPTAKRAKTTVSSSASSSKAAKTKLEKKGGSIADIGLVLRPNESVYLKCDTLQSMLRIINITPNDDEVIIPAAKCVQQALGRTEITGDDLPSHLPVGLGQSSQVRFQVVRINSDLVPGGKRELPSEAIEALSDGQRQWTMEELMDLIPPLPGSEGKKKNNSHYLGYRRSIWRALKHQTLQTNIEADIVLDVIGGVSLDVPYTCRKHETAIFVSEALADVSMAFVVPKQMQSQQQNEAVVENGLKMKKQQNTSNDEEVDMDDDGDDSDVDESISSFLDEFLKSIGTPGCVSLLQKVIRRRPAMLVYPSKMKQQIPAPAVIRAIVQRLLDPKQSGIFLPDQGVYVSAKQHFLKRLLVMTAEDSEYSDEKACLLASSALLLGCEPSWEPPISLHEKWIEIAIGLWQSPVTSDYDFEEGLQKCTLAKPVPFSRKEFPSLVLEELGGMRHDKGMMRYLKDNPRNTLRAEDDLPTGVDPLDIYCDQHVSGNIVHMWRPRCKIGPARIPYGPELDIAFQLVSGMNPRRGSREYTKDEQKHIKAILKAMKFCSKIIRKIPAKFPTTENPIEYEWEIPDGALAGMIGPLEVKVGSKTLVVTIDPTDLRRWVVIPKPSRSSNLKDISDEERKEGLLQAAEIFEKEGVKLRSAPHPSLDGLVAKFSSNKWQVGGSDWADRKTVKYYIVKYPDWEEDYCDVPFDSHKEYSQHVIQWVAGRIGGFEPVVNMPTVSRDGSGTKESLTGCESYSLLLKLSQKYPDALWPTGQFSFETKCIPLRLEIRRRLLSSLEMNFSDDAYPKWRDDRKLRPLQREALEGMLRADAAGMGSFLWMLVGSGKSMTVLSFIHQTRRTVATVWCLPMSAMKSVASEIRRAGWRVRVLSSTAGRLKQHEEWASKSERTLETTLRPGTITLVEHDDVRNLVSALSSQMLTTTFVYDEVHKAMAAKTQRTGSALRLAQLAKQMVALTGTPIVDSKAFTLINWLRFCVPFQVHSRNFWVAANSMIAKLTSTPVQIDRRTIKVPLASDQRQAIDDLLPARLGGTARKPDFKRAYELSLEYVDTWIVNESLRVVYGERGAAPEGCPAGEGHAYAVAATRLLPPTEALFDHLPQRVLLVAQDRNHGAALVNALLSKGVPAIDMMFIGGRARPDSIPSQVKHAATVCYTADEWRRGEWVPNICVAPISYCEGYSLTWMTTLISGVYPSNQSKRTQMEGRINRANCERLHRTYITAMAGLTEVMYKYQRNAKNLESALANLSKMKN